MWVLTGRRYYSISMEMRRIFGDGRLITECAKYLPKGKEFLNDCAPKSPLSREKSLSMLSMLRQELITDQRLQERIWRCRRQMVRRR